MKLTHIILKKCYMYCVGVTDFIFTFRKYFAKVSLKFIDILNIYEISMMQI